MIRNVALRGALATTFDDKTYSFKADTVRQLFAGLTSIFPTFRRELLKHEDLVIMKVNGDHVSFVKEEELDFKFGNYTDIYVGTGKRGEAAAGAGAFAGWIATAGTTAYAVAYAVAYIAISVAISYAISAVMTSLADTPNVEEAESRRDDKSALFNGPGNREIQGGRAQLIYGRFLVGTYTLSQVLEAKRQPIGLANSLSLTEGTTRAFNIFANDAALINPTVTTFNVGGTGPVNAGQTFTGTGYTITVHPTGDFIVATTVGSASTNGVELLVTVSATSDNIPFLQDVRVSITVDYARWNESYQS